MQTDCNGQCFHHHSHHCQAISQVTHEERRFWQDRSCILDMRVVIVRIHFILSQIVRVDRLMDGSVRRRNLVLMALVTLHFDGDVLSTD